MSFDKKKIIIAAETAFAVFTILARKKKRDYIYENNPDQKNPMEGKKVIFIKDDNEEENADGVCGHLEPVSKAEYHPNIYDKYIKRMVDIVLSFIGLILLSPIYLGIAAAIKIDDPGPVLFTQKRLGQNKKYFKLHKFRSMKMSAPHDIPTHMLGNPEQYITKVGKYLRVHSLDELPQIWDIFVGNMSIVGPRPALWNQDLLIAERDRYGANDVKPGLTGWAQINGRDVIEISEKAKLDGEYIKKESLLFDAMCFVKTVSKLSHDDSVAEGGAAETRKVGRNYTDGKKADELIGHIGFGEPVEVNRKVHKRVLITGMRSYIGDSFREYVTEHYEKNFSIDVIDMVDGIWREKDFSAYDTIYHVAGIAHADIGNVSEEIKENYYAVNTDLAVDVCKKAKEDGVKAFIFMSSMIVYGDSAPYGEKKIIDEYTVPFPGNFYGDSKLQADVAVRDLSDEKFKVIVLRPPMIYGKGSKGNYPILSKLAKKLPVFPEINNQKSALYIDNLCEFLCQIMLVEKYERSSVVFLPQNAEWIKTSKMVKEIAGANGRTIKTTKAINPFVFFGGKIPGRISRLVNKAFGNNCYSHSISLYKGLSYQRWNLKESIIKTEEKKEFRFWKRKDELEKYSVLMSVYSKEKPDNLIQSIESMLNQTVLCEQFVLVEDGPLTEELESIVQRYEKKYQEMFTIVRLSDNLGLGKALDRGLAECRNDLVARMDADDISLPERCEKLLKLFQEHEILSLAGTNINEFYDDPANIVSSRVVPSDYEDICRFMKRRSPFNHPTVMFRKSEVLRVGGYGNMRRKQDLDLFARMINQNCFALNINESLLLFRSDENNYMRRKSWEYCKSYIEVEFKNYKRGYCSLIDLAIVIIGQAAMYVSPMWVMKYLSDNFLRNTYR